MVHKVIATAWHVNRVLFNLLINVYCVTHSHKFQKPLASLGRNQFQTPGFHTGFYAWRGTLFRDSKRV